MAFTVDSSPAPDTGPTNPYSATLGIAGLLLLVIALFLCFVGLGESGSNGPVLLFWAGLLFPASSTALILWLVVEAIRWQPKTTARRTVDSRPPNADAPSID